MKHYGSKRVQLKTEAKKPIAELNFQVTDVRKPLAAVWRLAEKNHLVQFGPEDEDCFIKHKGTGDKIYMQRNRRSYVLQVEFVQAVEIEESASAVFRRLA